MKRHPRKHELLAYAESLVDRRTAISAKIGAHVAGCPACAAEVEGMRATLGFARQAPELEPTSEFTAQLLLAAQAERRVQQQRHARRSAVVALVKTLAYAAAILVICGVCFSAALRSGSSTWNAPAVAASPAMETDLSADAVRKAAADVQTLAAAVGAPSKKPLSVRELERRRTVRALDADIEAARAALERNPGCRRASKLVDTNLQRQAENLRALYLERSL